MAPFSMNTFAAEYTPKMSTDAEESDLYDLSEGAWFDATDYIVNANLKSLDGWDKSEYTAYDAGTYVPVIEFYHTWSPDAGVAIGNTKNFHITQKCALPEGIYRLSTHALYREGNGTGTNEKAYIFAGDNKQFVAGLTNAGVGGYEGGNDLQKAANAFSKGDFSVTLDFTVEGNAETELGFKGYIDTYCSWSVLSPLKLEKKQTLKDNFLEQAVAFSMFGQSSMAMYSLGAVQEKWAEVMAVVETLYGAVAAGDKVLKTDVEAAIELMATTMAEIKPVLEYYDGKFSDTKWDMYEIQENSTANTPEVAAAFEDAITAALNVSSVVTVTELEAKVAELEAARRVYVMNAVPSENFMFDYTFNIKNPNFDSNMDGWTTVKSGWNGGAGYDNVGGIAEIADWNATSWESSITQSLSELPNGKYVVKMAWMAATGIKMTLAANEASVEVVGIGDQGGNIANDGSVVEMGKGFRGWQYAEVEGVVENGVLIIKVSSASEAQHTWSNADSFELYYAGASKSGEGIITETIKAEENAVIYTITGKSIQGNLKSLERGIYIVNGKKVYVK